jgi:hypothetical protein
MIHNGEQISSNFSDEERNVEIMVCHLCIFLNEPKTPSPPTKKKFIPKQKIIHFRQVTPIIKTKIWGFQ